MYVLVWLDGPDDQPTVRELAATTSKQAQDEALTIWNSQPHTSVDSWNDICQCLGVFEIFDVYEVERRPS